MSQCKYCLTECAEKYHDECLQAYDRRVKENLCVRCGQNPITHDTHLWCGRCSGTSPYIGYAGATP